MSQMATEPAGRGRGNVFTRRIGPLPMWQWFLIALAMIGIYVIYEYRKKSQANANAANQAGGSAAGGTTGAGQVPQFVNQTYTYVAPPSAQPPPPSGHPRPAPAPAPAPAPSPSQAPQQPAGPAPNIRNMTLAAATQALTAAGYTVSNVSQNYQNLTAAQIAAAQGQKVWSFTPYGAAVRIGLY